MTGKKWEDLLSHAKTCPLNGKSCVFHDNERDHGVISDNVGQLTGPAADGVCRAAGTFSLKPKVTGKFYFFWYLLCNLRGITRDLRVSIEFNSILSAHIVPFLVAYK